MKNVQQVHKTLLAKAQAVAAKHDMHVTFATTAKHSTTEYDAKLVFIEKNDINRNWTAKEALYAQHAQRWFRIAQAVGKTIKRNGQDYIVIGMKTNRSDSKVVLRDKYGQLIWTLNNIAFDVALLTAK